jgi:hypothetical protein
MAGFLDPKTRIMDVVLTGVGRKLLAESKLHFCYWSAFDDEVDYDPFIADSGSLNEQDLVFKRNEIVETTFVREPVSGYTKTNRLGLDETNVHFSLFSKQQNKEDLPRALFPELTGSVILVKQRNFLQTPNTVDEGGRIPSTPQSIQVGYERLDAGSTTVSVSLSKDGFSPDFVPEGILVRFFKSGSEGLEEVSPRRDMANDLSVDRDLKVFTGNKE